MTADRGAWLFDFTESDASSGFRLWRFELFNWGTFDGHVWGLEPKGRNALLTGDIGSGKSTLVDAMTTLLVPARRITYNKAAGAEARERTARSYVLGHFRTERGDDGQASRSVALRDHNTYSVILGHFYNEAVDRHVTLAQVFYWSRDAGGQPERFFVVADRALNIVQDFTDFGSEITRLRKRLRTRAGVELFEAFPAYGEAFRGRLGLTGEQALELFNQTVSLKSVGNLTEFVRNHMLEPVPVDDRIDHLIGHFDDLDRAHRAVVTARRQVEALEPMIARVDEHAAVEAEIGGRRAGRDALGPWFARLRARMLRERIQRLDEDIRRLDERMQELDSRRGRQQGQRDELRQAIAENGGDRIERLKGEIRDLEQQRQQRELRATRYRAAVEALGWDMPGDARAFDAIRKAVEDELQRIDEHRETTQNALTEATVELQHERERHQELEAELDSLRQRRSNLPGHMLKLRELLCGELGLAEDHLPFIGELLQVHEQERDWEGAIERLLHNFGLSLLVPDTHYADVAAWVDRTHLHGRLVYYRVRPPHDARLPELHPQSLVRKLAIQPDSEYYPWLEQQLAERFDYACCEELTQFRREKRAITRNGQIRASGERHEKDDRRRLNDRRHYILGWSNEAKIAVLEQQAEEIARRAATAGERVAARQAELRGFDQRVNRLHGVQAFDEFRELNVRELAVMIDRLDQERRELEAGSDTLRTLQEQLAALEQDIAETEELHRAALTDRARHATRCEQDADLLAEDQQTLEQAEPQIIERVFPQLDALRDEVLGNRRLTVETCNVRQQEFREWLQRRLDADEKRASRLREQIVDAMRRYKEAWPQQTAEIDCSIDAADEFRDILQRLQADDLPRFEARFRELLEQNTAREIASFKSYLERERTRIRERIERINRSLGAIDYNPGRYIRLLAEPSPDGEIRDFRRDLRECTEGLTEEDERYSEGRFLQVRAIIDRLRGREGTSDLDRRWRRKVTDVRTWFVFSASERWREDNTEHEHYSDSGGKSGGQKEKLAYTVLAASLAYQFGLEHGEKRADSFRFVMIDEAFGRGSDESARYGLELFERLNLQLLVVTPLQKIHIIEPYVSSVGFVHNDGRQSLLRNLSIEEFRTEREAHQMIRMDS